MGVGRGLNLRGPANAFLGGWTANGIFYLSDGVPIASPIVGANVSYFDQRADLVCDASKGAPHTATAWFNPNCFALPASPFVAGTAPVYIDHVRTMGANDVDLSFYKTLSLGAERNLRFEISSFNIANRPQLGYPNVPSYTSGWAGNNFGTITNTLNTPRQFQFGSRFTF